MRKRVLATPQIIVHNEGAGNCPWFETQNMRDTLKKYQDDAFNEPGFFQKIVKKSSI